MSTRRKATPKPLKRREMRVFDSEAADLVTVAYRIRREVAALPEDVRSRLIGQLSADYIDQRRIDGPEGGS